MISSSAKSRAKKEKNSINQFTLSWVPHPPITSHFPEQSFPPPCHNILSLQVWACPSRKPCRGHWRSAHITPRLSWKRRRGSKWITFMSRGNEGASDRCNILSLSWIAECRRRTLQVLPLLPSPKGRGEMTSLLAVMITFGTAGPRACWEKRRSGWQPLSLSRKCQDAAPESQQQAEPCEQDDVKWNMHYIRGVSVHTIRGFGKYLRLGFTFHYKGSVQWSPLYIRLLHSGVEVCKIGFKLKASF